MSEPVDFDKGVSSIGVVLVHAVIQDCVLHFVLQQALQEPISNNLGAFLVKGEA